MIRGDLFMSDAHDSNLVLAK